MAPKARERVVIVASIHRRVGRIILEVEVCVGTLALYSNVQGTAWNTCAHNRRPGILHSQGSHGYTLVMAKVCAPELVLGKVHAFGGMNTHLTGV